MSHAAEASALAPLWTRARATFARALAALGGAATIAARAGLTRDLKRAILTWIVPLEHIVRKLLFAEAARFAVDDAKPFTSSFRTREARSGTQGVTERCAVAPGFRAFAARLRPRRRVRRCAAPRNDEGGEPSTWRITFAFAPPRDPRRVPEQNAPRIRSLWGDTPPAPIALSPKASSEHDTALHLARRFEALRRVLDNPAPHVRRLARLMPRLTRRFPEAPMRYAMVPARSGAFDRDDPRLALDAIGVAINGAYAYPAAITLAVRRSR